MEKTTPDGGAVLDSSRNGKSATEEASQRAAAEAAEAERRRSLLRLILSDEANERLARVALVKPEKARAVEDYLLQAARFGELTSGTRVTEDQLIALLQRLHTESESRPRVTISRRRTWSDDEDD
jgi:programmed cell death protein 5